MPFPVKRRQGFGKVRQFGLEGKDFRYRQIVEFVPLGSLQEILEMNVSEITENHEAPFQIMGDDFRNVDIMFLHTGANAHEGFGGFQIGRGVHCDPSLALFPQAEIPTETRVRRGQLQLFGREGSVMPKPLFQLFFSLIHFHNHQLGSCVNLLRGQSKKQPRALSDLRSKAEVRPRCLPKRERAVCPGSTKPSWDPRSAKRPRLRRSRCSRFCNRRDEVCRRRWLGSA